MCGTDIFLCCLAVLFPPIGVWIKRGLCSADSLINIALCVLGYLPGLIHSWYIIVTYPDEYEAISQDPEHGGGRHSSSNSHHVTYYYVQHGSHGAAPQTRRPPPGQQQYGTTGVGGSQQESGVVNQQPRKQQPLQGPAVGAGGVNAGPQAGSSSAGAGGNAEGGAPPPSYADVIKGDHKVQSRD